MMLSLEIFLFFFKIAIISFGGTVAILSEMERMLVNEHHWITHEQFIQTFVVAQFVPGPNTAMSPMIGYMVNGWSGFFAAFLGTFSAPIILLGLLYWAYKRYSQLLWVRRLELSLRPVIVGLMMASLFRLWWAQSNPGFQSVIFRTTAFAIGFLAIWLYNKKLIKSLDLIFFMGAAWVYVNWGILTVVR